jgi:hypothetical protein
MSEKSNKADAKQRSETLKRLREEHKETVERTRQRMTVISALSMEIVRFVGNMKQPQP